MTHDQIKELAREAGIAHVNRYSPGVTEYATSEESISKFAALVAAAEREACAKVCEGMKVPKVVHGAHPDYLHGKEMAFSQCGFAIRARGQA